MNILEVKVHDDIIQELEYLDDECDDDLMLQSSYLELLSSWDEFLKSVEPESMKCDAKS